MCQPTETTLSAGSHVHSWEAVGPSNAFYNPRLLAQTFPLFFLHALG